MMGNFTNRLQRYGLLRGIILLILGVLITILPKQIFNGMVYLVAIGFAIIGLVALVDGFKEQRQTGMSFGVTGGIVVLVFALIVYFLAKPLISMLPIFLGILLLIYGLAELSAGLSGRTYVNVTPWPQIIYGILLLIGAILLILNPFKSVIFLFRLFGVMLIVMSVAEIINWMMYNKQ